MGTINSSLNSLCNRIMTSINISMASSYPTSNKVSMAYLQTKVMELLHLRDNIFLLAGYSSGIKTANGTTI